MLVLNNIFSSVCKSGKSLIKNQPKAANEMDKYVSFSKPWEVADESIEYARQLFEIKDMVKNFAKHNNVHVDMFIPREKEILNISVSRLDKKGNALNSEKLSDALPFSNDLVVMVKDNPRMLIDKDELNYIVNGRFTREDNFIKQIYHTVSTLVNELNKAN